MFAKAETEMGDDYLFVRYKNFERKVCYCCIANVMLRDDLEVGEKVDGKKSVMCTYGAFRNSEYGEYDLVSHVTTKLLIVVVYGEDQSQHIAFNLKNIEETKEFYRHLKHRVGLL